MPINITMPALSPTMEEGNLSKWLVKEGDKVWVKLMGFDERGKVRLSMKVVDQATGKEIVADKKKDDGEAAE